MCYHHDVTFWLVMNFLHFISLTIYSSLLLFAMKETEGVETVVSCCFFLGKIQVRSYNLYCALTSLMFAEGSKNKTINFLFLQENKT